MASSIHITKLVTYLEILLMRRISLITLFATSLLVALPALTGCESKGPAQQAGESLDKGIEKAKDAVNPPGPVEKAGREVDKAIAK